MRDMPKGYRKFDPLSRSTVRAVVRAIKKLGKERFFVREVVEQVEGVSKAAVYTIVKELARYGFLEDADWERGKHYYRVTEKLRRCRAWE